MERPRHQPANEGEVLAVRALEQEGDPFAFLRVTETGLTKRILDANRDVRDHFLKSGFHDYAAHEAGAENRVYRSGVLVRGKEEVRTEVSLYRPRTKTGDPRFWPSGLERIANPLELLALVASTDSLRVVNLTAAVDRAECPNGRDQAAQGARSHAPHVEGPLARRIFEELRNAEGPLLAQDLARRLSTRQARITLKAVNGVLYGELYEHVNQDKAHRWSVAATTTGQIGTRRGSDDGGLAHDPVAEDNDGARSASEIPELLGARVRELSTTELNALADALLADGRSLVELTPLARAVGDSGLDKLDLKKRTFHILRRAGMSTTADLANYRLDALRSIRHVGTQTARDAVIKLITFAQDAANDPDAVTKLTAFARDAADDPQRRPAPRTTLREASVAHPVSRSVQELRAEALARWARVVGQPAMTLRQLASIPPDRIPSAGGLQEQAARLLDSRLDSVAPEPEASRNDDLPALLTALQVHLDSTREGRVFSQRNLGADRPTFADLGAHFDVSGQRATQLEASGRRQLADLVAADFQALAWACHEIRWRLGPMVPAQAFYEDTLVSSILDEERDHPPERRHLLFYLLSVQQEGDWIGSYDGPFPGTKAALEAISDGDGVVGSPPAAAGKVASIGVARRFALEWLASDSAIQKIDNVYVRWDGSAVERARAVLAVLARPVPLDVLIATIADEADHEGLVRRLTKAFTIDADGNVMIQQVCSGGPHHRTTGHPASALTMPTGTSNR